MQTQLVPKGLWVQELGAHRPHGNQNYVAASHHGTWSSKILQATGGHAELLRVKRAKRSVMLSFQGS